MNNCDVVSYDTVKNASKVLILFLQVGWFFRKSTCVVAYGYTLERQEYN